MATKLYPIGMQTFSEIREEDFLYVDKTEYIYRMSIRVESISFWRDHVVSESHSSSLLCRAISRGRGNSLRGLPSKS